MGTQAMSSGGAISRQGSVCSLTLSEVEGQLHGVNLDDLLRTAGSARKTADEVWPDIHGGRAPGQMTLEDFLSKPVGDARWAEQYNPAPPAQGHSVGRPLPRPLGVGAGPVLDALLCHDGAAAPFNGRKRAAEAGLGGPGEKTVERRKKRMIKNRESAARSRARKQAYTNELENKISRLEEENELLRSYKSEFLRAEKTEQIGLCRPLVNEIMQSLAFEPVVHYVPQEEPKNQLRRRNSASF